MNREEIASNVIEKLARLIVGHPNKLHSRFRKLGFGSVLFLRAVKSDTGRLVGPSGSIHRALQGVGSAIALSDFELIVEEPTEDARVIMHKPCQPDSVKVWTSLLETTLNSIFNGDFKLKWNNEVSSDLVEIEVGSGFEPERVENVADNLKLIFNAIGRAHNRNVRIWMAEVVK
jgi:predicted RNA-binding protein YlqC (UPF0109 family)